MAIKKNWIIKSNDENYEVNVELNTFSGRHKIHLNDVPLYFKATFSEGLIGAQRKLDIPGKEVYLQIRGRNVDLAVDGVFLDSKKEFRLIKGIPGWAWIFIVACFAIPVYTLGGAVPMMIAFLGAILVARISVSTNNSLTNIIASLSVTAISWGLLFAFIELLSELM